MYIIEFMYLFEFIHRIIRHTQESFAGIPMLQVCYRKSQVKLLRMTAITMAAFVLSWSPYCFVSLAGTIKGRHLLTSGEAEVPSLMAKASVIYNPLIYVVVNRTFRGTLRRIANGKDTGWRCEIKGSFNFSNRHSDSPMNNARYNDRTNSNP